MKIFKIRAGFITHLESYWLKSSNKIENYSSFESSSWIFFPSQNTKSWRCSKFDYLELQEEKVWHILQLPTEKQRSLVAPFPPCFSPPSWADSLLCMTTVCMTTELDFNFLWLIKPWFIWKTKHLKKRSWTCIYGGFWFCFILLSFSVSANLHSFPLPLD